MTQPETTQPTGLRDRLLAVGTVVLFVAGLVVVSQGLSPLAARFGVLLALVIESALAAGAWLTAAIGLGYVLRRALAGPDGELGVGLVAQAGLGIAGLGLIDWALGLSGMLNPTTAWVVTAAGWGGLAWQLGATRGRWNDPERWPTWPWPIIAAAPAAGLLIGATCLAPGGLWSSEFFGYDVLSYHLQLPQEWMRNGAITGLEHNVYSYLPNLAEATFMHLACWFGSAAEAAYAAQMLTAMITLTAATGIGRIVDAFAGDRAGAIAAGVYLAMPWTIVTGSMAYDEQAVMALGAAALLTALRGDQSTTLTQDARRGLIIGLLCGVGMLCKLTAAGMIALPIAVVVLIDRRGGARSQITRVITFALGAGVMLGLWMIRNGVWTGNPTFPFATELFGTAHWTPEQVARWKSAHTPDVSLLEAMRLFAVRVLGGFQFGYIVWPAALVGAIFGWLDAGRRRVAIAMVLMLIVQAGFWVFMTHHQSRFAIPMLLPACVLIGLMLGGRLTMLGGVIGVGLLTVASFALYLNQREGNAWMYIDGVNWQTKLNYQSPVYLPTNVINQLPPHAKVYAEGYATPLYIQRPITYHTVWDASPLGAALSKGGVTGARQWLIDHGYTHVLIDWGMLSLWTSPGNYGYDPAITRDRLDQLVANVLSPVQRWSTISLYRIR